ncbi:MAG: beta-galactosidase [Ruminococcaceae bacterium]|nr:beta-galactosidase [Oscillospiraceae bacterium]
MNFRQVHLDFHTSEAVPGIGTEFSKENFQEMLKRGHVNSITIFSKCHHGWSYHPTDANKMHPNLTFDLLQAQIEAAHEIGVKTPVYISAGLDEKYVSEHSGWLVKKYDGTTTWVPSLLEPGYHRFCFNTPYLDLLLSHIREMVERYDADGIFLDIVAPIDCYCATCIKTLRDEGKDPRDPKAIRDLAERVYANYAKRVEETVHAIKPEMPIFHNGGHIIKGRRELAHFNSHLELESLPTGGWGYDHFPMSARYAQGLGMEFLGMTGKFHTTWGEFGGYKHPNALKYEVSLAAANGAKCSIGDQLHPTGKMDEATYDIIGSAYSYLESIEEWCDNVTSVADVGVLSGESIVATDPNPKEFSRDFKGDIGCVRMLLENKILFDVLDLESDFSKYKVLILPDIVQTSPRFEQKLKDYVKNGGKLLATGISGVNEQNEFAFDFGGTFVGEHEYQPTYFKPDFALKSLKNAAFVIYDKAYTIEAKEQAGWLQQSYFNRDLLHFCSHYHTPCTNKNTSPGVIFGKDGAYIAWNIFTDYAIKGELFAKEVFGYVLDQLLENNKTLETNLPAQGIVTVQEQKDRYITHLLYAVPTKRGINTEIIEDLIPIYNTELTLQFPEKIESAYLAPQNTPVAFFRSGDKLHFQIDSFTCHQMLVLNKIK